MKKLLVKPVKPRHLSKKCLSERHLRQTIAPHPRTSAGLKRYIDWLLRRPHDYGSSVMAASLVATAAVNHAGKALGNLGFMHRLSVSDFVRRGLSLEGSFIIIKADDLLYPQFNPQEKLVNVMETWRPWLKEEAKKRLAEKPNGYVHPDVVAHWKKLAAFEDRHPGGIPGGE